MIPQGKGFYIWQIRRCESGNAVAIANAAVQAGLTHVLIKIADGTDPYNIDATSGVDLVPPVVQALRQRGVSPLGWHYVYGYEPEQEADIALQRISATGVDLYVIDAEAQYKLPGRDQAARTFMARLRASLPVFPMALSSYRYPTYHPTFPFQAFLESVDFNMPQVYWVEAHNPGEQLIRSLREFQAITPFRPLIPTGSAYLQGDWEPTPAEIIEFLDTARNLNLTAANFWEWGHTRLYLPDLWQTVADYDWDEIPSGEEIVRRYFVALNSHNPDQVVALYHPNLIHVTPQRTIQGTDLLRLWYQVYFSQVLPQATFTPGDQSGDTGSRHFSWTATSSAGNVTNGQDSFGLVDGKIVYHYTYFTVTQP